MIATLDHADTTSEISDFDQESSEEFRTELAHLCKMLSDANRLRIIFYLLKESELNVTEFCQRLDQSQPAVSHHLALLKQAGILQVRRDGKHNFYSVCRDRFQGVIVQLFESFLEPTNGEVRINDFLLTHARPTVIESVVAETVAI
ncbi:MAG: winged helix-turn-helix transcriptional regulator [Rhodopirellula sp.]|nr:winged helix-turn-helix transcriptional regulator [Rhodopirellula sp.]